MTNTLSNQSNSRSKQFRKTNNTRAKRSSLGLVLVAGGMAAIFSLAVPSAEAAQSEDANTNTGVASQNVVKVYGECPEYKTTQTINLEAVTHNTLTVVTALPAPGWWNGTTPASIKGGFEYCLAAYIAQMANLDELKVENVSFDGLVAGNVKNYDVAFAQVTITPKRKKAVTFTEPYFETGTAVLVKAGSDVSQQNIRDKKLGVTLGTSTIPWIRENLRPTKKLIVLADQSALTAALDSGTIDAFLQGTAIMLNVAAQSRGKLEVIGQYATGQRFAGIYPANTPDNNKVEIDTAIRHLANDGQLTQMQKKWLVSEGVRAPADVPIWSMPN